jgi:lipopolysaccharide export system permease protein
MKLIDRYLFRQLLGPTLLATAALSAVAVLSQSLSALDLIVNQGQSAAVFIKITLLGVPALISMILPIAIFVAALVALNRLHTEQEIVVCFAGGMSQWRVISPTIRLSCMAAIVALIINLWIQPLCARAMRAELTRVRTDLAATLVQEGQFTQPSPGLTVYAREVQSHGMLKSLFVDQEKADGESSTFTAKDGQIAERRGSPVLIMRHGSNQSLTRAGVLNYLAFDEYIFDLTPFLPPAEAVHYKTSDRYLHELFFPDLTQAWERGNRKKLYAEGHSRLASPLYTIAMVCLALSAVLGGNFSRLGYGRRIAIAAGTAAAVRIVGVGVEAVCDDNVWLNVVQYAVPLATIAWGLSRVFRQKAGKVFVPLVGAQARPAIAGAAA